MNKTKFPYKDIEKENIPCNFCGEDDFDVLAKKDRNNLSITTVLCRNCGLIYINPRMSKDSYERYYNEEYRDQMARFKGMDRKQTYTAEYQYRQAKKRTEAFVKGIEMHVKRGLTIEVGSSAGGVLATFNELLNVPVLGIEPSSEEATYANENGIKTIQLMFEDLGDEVSNVENVVALRSLNHMLNFHGFLVWANKRLNMDGRLILELMNFPEVVRHSRYLPYAIQIDHVYMFTQSSLKQFVEAIGFEVLAEGTDRKGEHMYIVAKKVKESSGARGERFLGYRVVRDEFDKIESSYLAFLLHCGIKRKVLIFSYKLKRALRKIAVFLKISEPK